MRLFWSIIHWVETGWNKWVRDNDYPLLRLIAAAFALSFSLTLGFFFAFTVATKLLSLINKLLPL